MLTLLHRILVIPFFLVWLWSALWNLLQEYIPTLPFLLGAPENAWRFQLLSGNVFFILHSLDTKGFPRTLRHLFWPFFWAFVFEHFGLTCYPSIGCPFGRYEFTAPVLNTVEGSYKLGVVPFCVMLSWFTWTYFIYHTSNLIAYGSTAASPNKKHKFTTEVVRMAILDGVLNSLRASVLDAIYSRGLGAGPGMLIWDLEGHTTFLDLPVVNFLMWLPAAFLISFCVRSYEYLLDTNGELHHPPPTSPWTKFLEFIIAVMIVGGFPVVYALAPDLPMNYRIVAAINLGIPSWIGLLHWTWRQLSRPQASKPKTQ